MTDEKIKAAVAVLRQGGVVVYPTDTVYGLGVDATNPVAVARLLRLKGRDVKKGISVMVSTVAYMAKIAQLTPAQRELLRRHLPGPYTFLLKYRPIQAIASVCRYHGNVAVRIPSHPVALNLARAFGKPITATSANRAGKLPLNSLESLRSLGADYVLWTSKLPQTQPSTIIDLTHKKPRVMRGGAGRWPW